MSGDPPSLPAATDTVFIVDDDVGAGAAYTALVISAGLPCECFSSAEEFLDRVQRGQPGCAIIDLRLGETNGMEVVRRLRQAGCPLPVVLVSGYVDVRTAVQAMQEGVYTVLEKPCSSEELLAAVGNAIEDNHTHRQRRLRSLEVRNRYDQLNARELRAMHLILTGYANKTVESRLGLSKRTVDRIRASILEKMNVGSFVELAATLTEAGLIDSTVCQSSTIHAECP